MEFWATIVHDMLQITGVLELDGLWCPFQPKSLDNSMETYKSLQRSDFQNINKNCIVSTRTCQESIIHPQKTFATLGFKILTPNTLVQSFSQEDDKKKIELTVNIFTFISVHFLQYNWKHKSFPAHIQLVLLGKWDLLADISSLKLGYTCQMNYSLSTTHLPLQ